MPSETPGARKALSSNVLLRMACARVNAIGSHPNYPVLGAMCRIQGIHPSPRWTPAAEAAVPGGWIYLARDGLRYANCFDISSFSIMAQSLVKLTPRGSEMKKPSGLSTEGLP